MILVIGFLLVCAFAYQFSVKNTLSNQQVFENLQKQLENERILKQNIAELTRQKFYLDSLLKVHNISTTNLQNELLKYLNTLSERYNCQISKFEEPHLDSVAGIEHTYNRFALKGNYKQLIQTLYDLEYDKNLGQLVSVSMMIKKDYKLDQTYLTADILLKNTK